jgi:hypothetical protein
MNAVGFPSRPPAAACFAITAATVVAAVTVLAVNGHPGSRRPAASSGAAVVGSLAELNRSPAGAVGVAEQAVIVLAQLAAAPAAERARRLGQLADPEQLAAIGQRLPVSPVAEQATGLLADVAAGRPVVAVATPLAARIEAYTADTATVAVWTVTVLATRRLGAADASWSTETVRLVYRSGRWLLYGYSSRSGPVPVCAQPATGLDSVLAFAAPAGGAGHATAG